MKKTLISFAAAGLGLIALQGCAVEQGAAYESEEDFGVAESALTGSATVTQTASWNNGMNFCVDVKLTNGLRESTSLWTTLLDLKTTKVTSVYNVSGLAVGNTGYATATQASSNAQVPSGGSATFSFCASAPNSWTRPVVRGFNMRSDDYTACYTNNGLHPTKAALAVAMAKELGRWEPLTDLVDVNGQVKLSENAKTKCGSNNFERCPNTKAILGQQEFASTVDQQVFNPTVFMTDLQASFNRHQTKIDDLKRNNPGALPIAHSLSLVSGPTNIGQVQNGVSKSCGPHYIFKATRTDGSALSSSEAANLANALCFYGQGSCGFNPYIGFTSSGLSACPSGQTCVAIDPTDGDNTETSESTAGTLPKYPMNRVWNPSNSLLNTGCMTTSDKYARLLSKCSTTPSTCGYLYCTAY